MTSTPASLHQPSLRDLFGLDLPAEAKASPEGSKVAVWVRRTNWKDDRYDTICLIHDVKSGRAYPLNQTGSLLQAEWLDEDTLAVLKEGSGKGDAPEAKNQIWLYEGLVGEGWMVTEAKSGVESFKPFAGGFLYLAADPEREENKARKDRFGQFAHFEQEDSVSALYYTGLEELRHYLAQVRLATEDEAKELIKPVIQLSKLLEQPLKIEWFVHSLAGEAVYLNCRQRDDLVYFRNPIVFCLQTDVKSAVYAKTAPISNLANAKTPMLIQHGSDDHRVPISNATELYRGLKEMGVPVELFVYPGFGHPITKPRENHAVLHQNLAWFSRYLLGEKLELL